MKHPFVYTIVGNIVPVLVPAAQIKPMPIYAPPTPQIKPTCFLGVCVSPKEWGLSLANKRPLRRKK